VIPIIRAVAPADGPVLVAIERQSFPNPSWDSAAFLRYDCTVAEVEGAVVGFLVSREVFPAVQETLPEREILNLAVAADYRRMGIASALLKHELKNPATYFLEVRESNVVAQQLYRKFGFAEVERRPGYYEFPEETGIVMRVKK